MKPTNSRPTIWEHAQSKGVSRRDFLTACAWMTAMLGLPVSAVAQVTQALETKPRLPVLWFHFQECTCCSESFIRSAHPLAKDVVLSMLSLDYDDTLMAAAGHQAEEIIADIRKKYKGNFILAVEGNPPLNEEGMYCIHGGRPFVEVLKETARRLLSSVRSYDFVGRYGGEEFLVELNNCDPAYGLTRAEDIRKIIAQRPVQTPGSLVPVTMSLGLLLSQEWGYRPVEELLQEADAALYAAKAAGRNCVKVATPKIQPDAGDIPVPELARRRR